MLGTDDKLKSEINKAARATGELVWELPLWESYSELIKSDIADYKNSGGRVAGTITAAAFLSKFVGDYPWVHLDIAGPAWRAKDIYLYSQGSIGSHCTSACGIFAQSCKKIICRVYWK